MFLALMVIACSILRVLGAKHIAFQAVAHIVVGALGFGSFTKNTHRKLYIALLVVFSAVELICFFVV